MFLHYNVVKLHYCVFIFVLLEKNIGRQTATRIHEQKAIVEYSE